MAQVRKVTENMANIRGLFTGRQVVETAGGQVIGLSDANRGLQGSMVERCARRGLALQTAVIRQNLVVKSGRGGICRLLGGDSQSPVNRVQLGDTKISGVVSKSLYPPDLSDTSLINELRTLLGGPGGTFELDEVLYPEVVTKTEPAGLPGGLTAGPVSVFSDPGADFVAAGVTDSDVVTLFIGDEDFTLGIREVIGPTSLEVDNPSQLSAAGVAYRVTTPGAQVLFRKLISGNNFPESTFGPLTIAHEAGLLFSNGTLFNRVTFSPGNDAIGLIFQPRDVDGLTLSVQLDWLITL